MVTHEWREGTVARTRDWVEIDALARICHFVVLLKGSLCHFLGLN